MSLPQMRGSESCQVRMASSQRSTSSLSSSSPESPRLLSRADSFAEMYHRSCPKSMSSKIGMLPRRSADLHCPGAGIGVTTADSRSMMIGAPSAERMRFVCAWGFRGLICHTDRPASAKVSATCPKNSLVASSFSTFSPGMNSVTKSQF